MVNVVYELMLSKLIQARGLLAQKARKKLGQQAGIDYLKYLAEQGKEVCEADQEEGGDVRDE